MRDSERENKSNLVYPHGSARRFEQRLELSAALPDFPDATPDVPLDPEQIEYSVRDVTHALGQGMTEACVRHHCRKLFPKRGGKYRFDLKEATRALNYIRKVRHKERQKQTIVLLTQHLQSLKKLPAKK